MRTLPPSTPPALHEPGPLLMVDDDPLDLRIARRCHARSGIDRPLRTFDEPTALLTHLEAVGRGEAPRPALLLVDVRMPGVDGFEVVRRVRAQAPFTSAPPIAMLTTSDLDEDRETASAVGCAAYLVKPQDTRSFIELFRAMGP